MNRNQMLAFICIKRPLSINARNKTRFQEEIRRAFSDSYSNLSPREGLLYGTVYYFHTVPRSLDADNLSKPVWDALKGLTYNDDSQIRLRHAGVIDLREVEFKSFNLSKIPDTVANALLDVLGTEPHVVYIELGPLQDDMYEFGRG